MLLHLQQQNESVKVVKGAAVLVTAAIRHAMSECHKVSSANGKVTDRSHTIFLEGWRGGENVKNLLCRKLYSSELPAWRVTNKR